MSKVQKIYLSTATVTLDDITTIKGMSKILHDVKLDIFKGVTRTIITPSKDLDDAFDEFSSVTARAYSNDVLMTKDIADLIDYAVERAKEVEIAKGSDD